MNFSDAVRSGFSNFVNFHGRAGRAEFWYWFLFANLVLIGTSFLPAVAGIASLGLLIPSLAMAARRLHDTGKSGAWLLWNLVPVVGQFVLLMAMVQQSTPGNNQFGANPLGYSANYYQSQQYLPAAGHAQLPAPNAFPGHSFNFAPEPEPVKVPTEQDVWASQFNNLHRAAATAIPDTYKKHYFTEDELRGLKAGRATDVLLVDDYGDIYRARVSWAGSTFIEERLEF